MNNSRNRCLYLLTVVAVAIPLLAHADEKKLRIVFNPPNLALAWNAAAAHAAQQEAKKLQIDLILQDGQGSSPVQSSALRNAVNQGVDGILLGAFDENALVPAVNDVIASGIPIVSFDRSVNGAKKKLPYFGLDNTAAGVAMAKYVMNKFPDGAKIVFLTGSPGSSPAIDRAKGVRETLKPVADKYKIVADQTANWSRSEGLTVAQNILTSLGTPPDAIIGSNDEMALGALQALQQAKVPKGKVLVIGCDGIPESLGKIRDGEMSATVEYPLAQVTMAMDALVAYLREKKPIEGKLLTPVVIDKSNLTTAERYSEVK